MNFEDAQIKKISNRNAIVPKWTSLQKSETQHEAVAWKVLSHLFEYVSNVA